MQTLRLNQDVMPLSEFRSHLAPAIEKLRKDLRPMLLTQHGKGVAVIVDVDEFEAMREKLEVLEGIAVAEEQLAKGEFYTQTEMEQKFLARYAK